MNINPDQQHFPKKKEESYEKESIIVTFGINYGSVLSCMRWRWRFGKFVIKQQ